MNKTTMFLETISKTAKNLILDNIANHYGISRDDADEEFDADF